MRILAYILIGLVVLVLLGLGLIRGLNYFPGTQEQAEISCPGTPATLKKGTKLKVLSWNVQYSASRKHHFFYDGGKAVYVPKSDVEATIKQLSDVVNEVQPDIILWQEIDRDSNRTQRIDQLKALWKASPGYACWAATPYHKSAFVPTPNHKFLKRVNMQLVVFSKYKISKGIRHALPQLNESFVRKAFNLKRAVLQTDIAIEGGGTLRLLNTHFSAFSYGDGTLERQVETFTQLATKAEKLGGTWLGAGDFNMLPPGDNPKRLGKDGEYYPAKNPISSMFQKLTPALSVDEYKKSPDKYYTYIPYGAKQTDRWIDHVFVGKKTKVESYAVLQQYNNISDHLPIVVELTLLQ